MPFEVNPALLSHAPVVASSGSLENSAAAISKAVAAFEIAKLSRLPRVAKPINAVGKRLRVTEQSGELG
ncbi:MAG: hypothetical protein WB500_02185 [Rhodoplanes sp.]